MTGCLMNMCMRRGAAPEKQEDRHTTWQLASLRFLAAVPSQAGPLALAAPLSCSMLRSGAPRDIWSGLPAMRAACNGDSYWRLGGASRQKSWLTNLATCSLSHQHQPACQARATGGLAGKRGEHAGGARASERLLLVSHGKPRAAATPGQVGQRARGCTCCGAASAHSAPAAVAAPHRLCVCAGPGWGVALCQPKGGARGGGSHVRVAGVLHSHLRGSYDIRESSIPGRGSMAALHSVAGRSACSLQPAARKARIPSMATPGTAAAAMEPLATGNLRCLFISPLCPQCKPTLLPTPWLPATSPGPMACLAYPSASTEGVPVGRWGSGWSQPEQVGQQDDGW